MPSKTLSVRYEVELSTPSGVDGPPLVKRMADSEAEARAWAEGMKPEFTARIWRNETTRVLLSDVVEQARTPIEPVLHVTWSVIAYDCAGYGDDRSRDFSNGREAVDYARSLSANFGALVIKRVTMDRCVLK